MYVRLRKASVVRGRTCPVSSVSQIHLTLIKRKGKKNTTTPGYIFTHASRHAECELKASQRLKTKVVKDGVVLFGQFHSHIDEQREKMIYICQKHYKLV